MSQKNMFKQLFITSYFKKSKSLSQDLNDIKIDAQNEGDYFITIKNIRGHDKDTGNWHCLECGENMGDNPRQLCGKSRCLYFY